MGNIDTTELLKYATDNGMINLSYVQEQIEMKKREEILAKHPYRIYESSDGNWHTYLPGRIHRKRRKKEDIEDLVIDYWREQEENPTVEEIYFDWRDKKLERNEISKQTRDRYNRQFDQCFESLRHRKIKSITEADIEDFILDVIPECKLTVKGWSNTRTLIYGIFKRAKKLHYVDFSITEVVADIEISKKSFRRVYKEDDELVFMDDEKPRALDILLNNLDLKNLGILLMFVTGMRVGELVALKPGDITGNVIHVGATEICYIEDGKYIYEVREFPKTEAGVRDIVIKKEDEWIVKRIRQINPFGKYLFEVNGKRLLANTFRTRMGTVCKKAKVVPKSPNKIRKTYGTTLIDNGVNESVVIAQMGHTNIATTKGHYYRNTKNVSQKEQELKKVSVI